MSKEEELGMRRDRRKVDVREEYYVRSLFLPFLPPFSLRSAPFDDSSPATIDTPPFSPLLTSSPSTISPHHPRPSSQRMQAAGTLDPLADRIEGWENKRVERLPGQAEWGELPVAKKTT